MRFSTKLLFILFVNYQYSNAVDAVSWGSDNYPIDCSLSQYAGKGTECVKLIHREINERLDRVYSQLLKTLPKDNATQLTKQYKSWLDNKNRSCFKYSNNEIKLKSCYINKNIDKINELWNLDNDVNKEQFEGKWVECFKANKRDHKICAAYFLIQQDDNICGTYQDIAGTRRHHYRALFKSEDGRYARSVNMCDDSRNIQDRYAPCETENHTYDDEGSILSTNYIQTSFSSWTQSDYLAVSSDQNITKDFSYTSIKTSLPPNVKEDLIKNNKWLRDCLNYKGE